MIAVSDVMCVGAVPLSFLTSRSLIPVIATEPGSTLEFESS